MHTQSSRPATKSAGESTFKIPRAPAPRPYFPELHARSLLARCVEVRPGFYAPVARPELHLYWELQEAPGDGAIVWQKLNADQENPGHGSYYYKWFSALVMTPREGDPMDPELFVGTEANITLRTVAPASGAPYTIVDSSILPTVGDA